MNTIEKKSADILEEGVWLSESILWKRIGEFYQNKGMTAWHNSVPYQVTSNPRIAVSYTEMILSFLEDWIAQHGKINSPCYIVEMGAGHGSFSLMMLRTIEAHQEDFSAMGVEVKYILTDLAETNVNAWKEQGAMASYLDSGLAQVSTFNCLEDQEIRLSGKKIEPEGAPWIYIANYLFDSLPQEVFLLEKENILRAEATVSNRADAMPNDPDKWMLKLDYKPFSMSDLNPSIAGLLGEYRKNDLQGCLLLPSGAIRCIENIRNMSEDRFLLLSSDKALSTQNSVSNRSPEEITHFISVSMIVNFHALMVYFQHEGGTSWLQNTQQEFLASAAFCIGTDPTRMRRTQRTFSNQLDRNSPGDLYTLSTQLLTNRFSMSVGSMNSLLKLMDWDAAIFEALYDALLARLTQASPNEVSDLLNALPLIAERRYPLPGSADTLFRIGHLLQCLQRWPSAIEIYKSRMEERGESSELSYNLGLCYYAMEDFEQAKACFKQAVTINPDMLLAQGWLYRMGETTENPVPVKTV